MLRHRCRRYPRRLDLRFSTGDGALPRSACTVDLSDGGLSLVTGATLSPGAHLLGRLRLPTGKLAELHGVVAWTRPFLGLPRERSGKRVGLRLVWAEQSYLDYLSAAEV